MISMNCRATTLGPDELPNDFQLADAFKKNERAALKAFSLIWKKYHKALVIFANHLVRNDLVSEDVVSEAFTKLWQLRDNFDSEPSIRSFLYVAVRNACYDHLRSREIHLRVHEQIFYSSDCIVKVNYDDYDMKYAEYMHQLSLQVKELPDRCREVFSLYFFERLSTREISIAMNISEQTVRNQKTKAVSILRSAILKKISSY